MPASTNRRPNTGHSSSSTVRALQITTFSVNSLYFKKIGSALANHSWL